LFKTCNLVLGGNTIVTSLYGSLDGQRQRQRQRQREKSGGRVQGFTGVNTGETALLN